MPESNKVQNYSPLAAAKREKTKIKWDSMHILDEGLNYVFYLKLQQATWQTVTPKWQRDVAV